MNQSGSRATPNRVHVSCASDPLWFIAPRTSEKFYSLLIFTFISLYRLLKIVKVITFKIKKRTYTQFVFKLRNGIDDVMVWRLQLPITHHLGESHVFYDVKFDHVKSRGTMLIMDL